MNKRKQYTAQFKREAVRLMESSDKPASDVARQLGVRRNQLYKWKEQLGKRGAKAFPGAGRQQGKVDELTRLRQELEKVREERDILKKAAAYFAKELG
jgi:transposase